MSSIKKSVLLEEIRSIVREELKRAFHNINESSRSVSTPVRKQVPSEKRPLLSKNPKLNALLQETAGSGFSIYDSDYISDENLYEEWPTMNSRMLSASKSIQAPVNVNSMLPTTDLNGQPIRVNANEIPDDVANALTKDYRALMTAIKKRNGR